MRPIDAEIVRSLRPAFSVLARTAGPARRRPSRQLCASPKPRRRLKPVSAATWNQSRPTIQRCRRAQTRSGRSWPWGRYDRAWATLPVSVSSARRRLDCVLFASRERDARNVCTSSVSVDSPTSQIPSGVPRNGGAEGCPNGIGLTTSGRCGARGSARAGSRSRGCASRPPPRARRRRACRDRGCRP